MGPFACWLTTGFFFTVCVTSYSPCILNGYINPHIKAELRFLCRQFDLLREIDMFVATLALLLFVGLEAKPQWGSGEQSWDRNTKFENADDKYEMISHEVLDSNDVSLPSLINK